MRFIDATTSLRMLCSSLRRVVTFTLPYSWFSFLAWGRLVEVNLTVELNDDGLFDTSTTRTVKV